MIGITIPSQPSMFACSSWRKDLRYSERYTTAFHESGHAVTRIARGIRFTYIEIYDDPKAEGRHGFMEVEGFRGLHNIKSYVVSDLAGIPSERLIRPHKTRFELILTSCKDDWVEAKDLCEYCNYDIDDCLNEAGRLVRRLAPAIKKVAAVLDLEGFLDYEGVLGLIPEVHAEGEAFLRKLSQEIVAEIR